MAESSIAKVHERKHRIQFRTTFHFSMEQGKAAGTGEDMAGGGKMTGLNLSLLPTSSSRYHLRTSPNNRPKPTSQPHTQTPFSLFARGLLHVQYSPPPYPVILPHLDLMLISRQATGLDYDWSCSCSTLPPPLNLFTLFFPPEIRRGVG